MRRKSTRQTVKPSPDKSAETVTRKSRRYSKRHKRSSSQSSTDDSDDVSLKELAQQSAESVVVDENRETDNNTPEQAIWKVTPTAAPSGEIQKLKICLTRPMPSSPEKTERSSRRRQTKSATYLEDDNSTSDEKLSKKTRQHGSPAVKTDSQEEESEEQEDKKGKGKSKTKHKSKIEKPSQIQDDQDQTQSEISENVQVTLQSPQAAIEIRVDNETVSALETETPPADDTQSGLQNINTSDSCDVTSEHDITTVSNTTDKHFQEENKTSSELPSENWNSSKDDTSIASPLSTEPSIEMPPLFINNENENSAEVEYKTQEQSCANDEESTNSVIPENKLEESLSEEQLSNKEKAINEDKEAIVENKNVENTEVVDSDKVVENKVEIDQNEEVIENKDVVQGENIVENKEIIPNKDEVKENREVCENVDISQNKEVIANQEVIDENEEVVEHKNTVIEDKDAVIEDKDTGIEDKDTDVMTTNKEELKNEEVFENQAVSENKENSTDISLEEQGQSDIIFEQKEHKNDISSNKPDGKDQEMTENELSIDKKSIVDESNDNSISVSELHQSDDDSRPVEITTEANSTNKDKTLDISHSFSPEIGELVEKNQQIQDLKNEIQSVFRTPKKSDKNFTWGNSLAGLELYKPFLYKIDIDSIKELYPDMQFLEENEIKMDVRDRRKSYLSESKDKWIERKVSVDYKSEDEGSRRLDTQTSVNSSEMEENVEPEGDNLNIIAMNRKISIVDDTAGKLKSPPSPAKNPLSEVLFITNLVRPFTLKQLKELLERTGKIRENGFWTDRIKSKCYVYYETKEEAEATRNALHGVHWPIGNGKKLIIEYSTEEELEQAQNPSPAPAPAPVIQEPIIQQESYEEQAPPKRGKLEEPEKIIKDRERHKNEAHIREWDIGKENLYKLRSQSREREARSERNERRRHKRSSSPVDDFLSRKQKKKEEDIPQKLMDDLFRKTKATPSIYWLPLTPEEIATKQQQRLLRMAEHKRRMEESSRNRVDYGRGLLTGEDMINLSILEIPC